MKIFVMDCSWAGCIVVQANDEKEARQMMRSCENYNDEADIEEPFVGSEPQVIYYNTGDL